MKTKITLITGSLICIAMMASAQLQYIDNIQVAQRTDASGLVDVHFDLVAMQNVYYIFINVSFDGGDTFASIHKDFLTGDIGPLNPGTGYHIVWDGLQSFPDTYGPSSQLEIIAYICPELFITDVDGNVYNIVGIGNQCWMKEHLKTTKYSNGTPIPNVTIAGDWENLITGAYAWYDNDISWKDKYGALYNWHAVNNAHGLCPTGWHVPSHAEWTQLTDFIGGTSSPNGNKLKSCRQHNSPLGGDCNTSEHPRWNQHSTQYGTDDYGFSGLPGGRRNSTGSFSMFGGEGSWWSSTEASSSTAWLRGLYNIYNYVGVYTNNKQNGYSIRCLRD